MVARRLKALVEYIEHAILASFDDATGLAMAAHETEQSVVRQKELSAVLDILPRLSDQLRRGEVDLRRLEAVHERVADLPTPAMVDEVEDAPVGWPPA